MKKELFTVCLFVIFVLSALCSAEEMFSNENFILIFDDDGLKSLKRPKDIYDTDFILDRNNIGDVFVSYKTNDSNDWKSIHKAKLQKVQGNAASYDVGIQIDSFISQARPSASIRSRAVYTLNDGAYIENSSNRASGFLAWRTRGETKQWAQYDFPKEVTVSAVEVYWFDDHNIDGPYRVPKSWRLLYKKDDEFKEVENHDEYTVAIDKFNRVTFKPVKTSALRLELELYEDFLGGIHEWRVQNDEDEKIQQQSRRLAEQLAEELKVTSAFELKGDCLLWTVKVKNLTDKPLEVGALGLPLRFNTRYVWDKNTTYNKRLIRHNFVSDNASFVFWMRTNGAPPYLLMTPEQDAKLEYFDTGPERRRVFCPYVHSKARAEQMRQTGGNWRQENTSATLAPKGKSSDEITYTFRFRWADGYDGVRQKLYEQGKFDINIVPGMTVPTDLFALLALRTKNKIDSIKPEHPDKTKIEYLGEKKKDIHVYKLTFSKLGENLLTVNYDKDKKMVLEFFATEPLETLIKKRSAFLVNKHQHRDPSKWYNGVYSDWDMKNLILRSADDRDGLSSWLTDACDDAGNARPAYIASKNVFFPNQAEIESVDYYIKHYLWGGMQCTEEEQYPYAIYGIPNWKVNRDSSDEGINGKKHIWRIYDYPHIVLLYYRMYQIAKFYPEMKTELTKDQYLTRSYKTAIAYFTVPLAVRNWSAYGTGTMNEIIINDLLKALDDEGKTEEAAELRKHWEKKVEHFINDDPYLFGSEFPFDSTGFESTGAFAQYARENLNKKDSTLKVKADDANEFTEKQLKLNIAARGWLETAYYMLGSDFRAMGSMSYCLSYMSHMGGWSIVDYALNYAKDPIKYLRLGYASYLSAWALMNSGTPESNYGYWYPGLENDGGAGGGFEPAGYARGWLGKSNARGSWYYSAEEDVGYNAAIRTSAAIVADDPIFGLFAYGGLLTKKKDAIEVIPRDGLRQRFHIIKGGQRFHMLLERDGFAKDKAVVASDSLDRINFILENRAASNHTTNIRLSGLVAGSYTVKMDGKVIENKKIENGLKLIFRLPVSANIKSYKVDIVREKDS